MISQCLALSTHTLHEGVMVVCAEGSDQTIETATREKQGLDSVVARNAVGVLPS